MREDGPSTHAAPGRLRAHIAVTHWPVKPRCGRWTIRCRDGGRPGNIPPVPLSQRGAASTSSVRLLAQARWAALSIRCTAAPAVPAAWIDRLLACSDTWRRDVAGRMSQSTDGACPTTVRRVEPGPRALRPIRSGLPLHLPGSSAQRFPHHLTLLSNSPRTDVRQPRRARRRTSTPAPPSRATWAKLDSVRRG